MAKIKIKVAMKGDDRSMINKPITFSLNRHQEPDADDLPSRKHGKGFRQLFR